MSSIVIHGGKPLHGIVTVGSAKNAAVAILAATLAVRGRVTLTDAPDTEEVKNFLSLLASIGVKITHKDAHTITIDTSPTLVLSSIDKNICADMRASLLLFGALAAREKRYALPRSGGCDLGVRTVHPHLFALKKFGITIRSMDTRYEVSCESLRGADVVMYESGDTTTENAILAAVLAEGVTTIRYASANYMVQDLCYFLVAGGAKISGIGTTTLRITGVRRLHASRRPYPIMPDPIEAMSFISLAIATKSELTVANCPIDFLELELEKLSVMGQQFTQSPERRSSNGHFRIVDITLSPSALKALPDKLYGRPYPGLNIDNVPLFLPIMLAAKGRSLIHDWVYENRSVYALDLQKLGANIILLDPHRLFVEGPASLSGGELIAPPAIRPAMAILITMLAAKGRSVLHSVYPLLRAHEHLIERLNSIGADVEWIS